MFIRIKRRALKSSDIEKTDFSLRAYVVENRRVKGDPRQRVIAYLGSVRSSEMTRPTKWKPFLRNAFKQMDALTSDYQQIKRLKLNLIDLIVKERQSNWYTSEWTDQWFTHSAIEGVTRSRDLAQSGLDTAATETEKAVWNMRLSRAEKELQRRRT